MSTTVTFAGNLAEDAELVYTHDGKPLAGCRVLVNCRVQNHQEERVSGGPRQLIGEDYRPAPHHGHDSRSGSGEHIFGHGLEGTASWCDRETRGGRTEHVVFVDDPFGEVGVWLAHLFGRIERTGGVAALAG